MEGNKTFSLVVPAWNAQDTIQTAILSILGQSFSDYEIVIVDDGSSDATAMILNDFEYCENITIVSQKNAGVSAARNAALKHCSGRYVVFLDADDWIDEDLLQEFHDILLAPAVAPDLIVGNLLHKSVAPLTLSGRYSGVEIAGVLGALDLSDNLGYLHNKCYRKALLDKHAIRFNEALSMSEDLLFNLQFIGLVDSLVITPSAHYHYECRAGSLSGKKSSYEEIRQREGWVTRSYNQLANKYGRNLPDDFLKGVAKRKVALDMQRVTAMYHATFAVEDILREIDAFHRCGYLKNVFSFLNRNEKIKFFIMQMNSMVAYYSLYALYKMKVF